MTYVRCKSWRSISITLYMCHPGDVYRILHFLTVGWLSVPGKNGAFYLRSGILDRHQRTPTNDARTTRMTKMIITQRSETLHQLISQCNAYAFQSRNCTVYTTFHVFSLNNKDTINQLLHTSLGSLKKADVVLPDQTSYIDTFFSDRECVLRIQAISRIFCKLMMAR